MKRVVAITLALFAPACALLVQIDDYVLVPADGGTGDAAVDGTVLPDGSDAQIAPDAKPDTGQDAAPFTCTPCSGAGATACGLSCDETAPTLLTLDGTRLLWLANGSTVRASPVATGSPSTFANLPTTATSMVATGGVLAWADATSLRANPLDGGAPVTLKANELNVSSVAGTPPASAPGILFWTVSTTGAIRRCGIAACTSTAIDQIPGEDNPTSLATGFDGTNPYGIWANRGVAVKTIHGGPLAGGQIVNAHGQDPLMTAVIAIEPTGSSKIFYVTTNGAASQIWQAAVGIVASINAPIKSMAASGSSLWVLAGDFNDPKMGRLVRYNFPGPTRTDLVVGLDSPQFLTVDATSAYWTQTGSGGAKGAVFRVAR